MSKRGRGRCPVCQREISLNAGLVIRRHYPPGMSPYKATSTRCPGSTQPPAVSA